MEQAILDGGSTVFVIVENMEVDRGCGAAVSGVFSTEQNANERIKQLESKANQGKYKYPVSWFVVEVELDSNESPI